MDGAVRMSKGNRCLTASACRYQNQADANEEKARSSRESRSVLDEIFAGDTEIEEWWSGDEFMSGGSNAAVNVNQCPRMNAVTSQLPYRDDLIAVNISDKKTELNKMMQEIGEGRLGEVTQPLPTKCVGFGLQPMTKLPSTQFLEKAFEKLTKLRIHCDSPGRNGNTSSGRHAVRSTGADAPVNRTQTKSQTRWRLYMLHLNRHTREFVDRLRKSRRKTKGLEVESELWKRRVLMGRKCKLPEFSGVLLYDRQGNQLPVAHITPRGCENPMHD